MYVVVIRHADGSVTRVKRFVSEEKARSFAEKLSKMVNEPVEIVETASVTYDVEENLKRAVVKPVLLIFTLFVIMQAFGMVFAKPQPTNHVGEAVNEASPPCCSQG